MRDKMLANTENSILHGCTQLPLFLSVSVGLMIRGLELLVALS
jgi:hypothetical protein